MTNSMPSFGSLDVDPAQPIDTVAPPVVVPATAPPSDSESIEQRLAELEQLAYELDEEAESEASDPQVAELPTDFRLSIVVPVFNEETTILRIVGRLLRLSFPVEIIVVDDGSTDGTRDKLRQLEGLPGIRVILKPANEGKGAALRTGFQHVRGTVVLVQDADLEYDPRDIPRLLEPLINGTADVVYGSRFLEKRWHGSSTVHRAGNQFLTAASNAMTGLSLTDMETCYKAFHARFLADLTIRQNRFGFEPEVTAKLARRGLRFHEIPRSVPCA